jgi:hypothetical protein
MDTFFDGAQVRLEGLARAGEQLVVVIRGEDHEEVFNRRRRFGPVWLSSGKVSLSGVPSVWLLFASAPVRKILSPAMVEKHRLDRAALMAPTGIEGADGEEDLFRAQYFELKQARGLYASRPDAVRLRPSGDGAETAYSLDFLWPKTAPPAHYRALVYFCRDGGIAGMAEAPLEMVKVGAAKEIAELSTSRANLYGLLCILAAALAGFGMDRIVVLLGGKRAAH